MSEEGLLTTGGVCPKCQAHFRLAITWPKGARTEQTGALSWWLDQVPQEEGMMRTEVPALAAFMAKLEQRTEPLALIVSEEMLDGWRQRRDILIFPAELLKLITDVLEEDDPVFTEPCIVSTSPYVDCPCPVNKRACPYRKPVCDPGDHAYTEYDSYVREWE